MQSFLSLRTMWVGASVGQGEASTQAETGRGGKQMSGICVSATASQGGT